MLLNGPGTATGRGASDSVTLVYVPFVRENENFVNASLIAEISPTDTAIDYICDWQYHVKEHGSPAIDSTAEAWATTLMILDKQVFGHAVFIITDTTLFSSGPVNSNLDSIKRKVFLTDTVVSGRYGRQSDYYQCTAETIQEIEYHCTGCTGACDYCPICISVTLSTHLVCTLVTGGNSGGSGNNNGGGGGNNGGGSPPECESVLVRSATVNEQCEAGWEPEPPPPPPPPPATDTLLNPCADAAALQNSASFISYMQELKDSANSNKEYAYCLFKDAAEVFGNTPIGLIHGSENRLGINDFVNNYMLDAIVHSHFNTNTDSTRGLSVFSPDDLWSMCLTFNDGNMNNTVTFSLGLVTQNGTKYLLKVENQTKFRIWADKFVREKMINHKTAYLVEYKINSTNSNDLNEKNFLLYLRDNASGLKLFKGNDDFTQWTSLGLDTNNNVAIVPCQ